MVASSPVRHEPGPNMQPAPVESYQAPWKALSEFAAMGGDMEQPPFQQLVSSFAGPPPPPRPGTGHTDSDADDESIVTSLEDGASYPPLSSVVMAGGGGDGGVPPLPPPPHHFQHHLHHQQLLLGPPPPHLHGLPPHPMIMHDLDAKC